MDSMNESIGESMSSSEEKILLSFLEDEKQWFLSEYARRKEELKKARAEEEITGYGQPVAQLAKDFRENFLDQVLAFYEAQLILCQGDSSAKEQLDRDFADVAECWRLEQEAARHHGTHKEWRKFVNKQREFEHPLWDLREKVEKGPRETVKRRRDDDDREDEVVKQPLKKSARLDKDDDRSNSVASDESHWESDGEEDPMQDVECMGMTGFETIMEEELMDLAPSSDDSIGWDEFSDKDDLYDKTIKSPPPQGLVLSPIQEDQDEKSDSSMAAPSRAVADALELTPPSDWFIREQQVKQELARSKADIKELRDKLHAVERTEDQLAALQKQNEELRTRLAAIVSADIKAQKQKELREAEEELFGTATPAAFTIVQGVIVIDDA